MTDKPLTEWVAIWKDRGLRTAPMSVFFDANKEAYKRRPKYSRYLVEDQSDKIRDEDKAYCVVMGDGVVCLDIDENIWVNRLFKHYKNTYHVGSPSGMHAYFKTDKNWINQPIREDPNDKKSKVMFEVKSKGQTITGPGSCQNPNAKEQTMYHEVTAWETLSELPEELAKLMKERTQELEITKDALEKDDDGGDASIVVPRDREMMDDFGRNNWLTQVIGPKLIMAGLRRKDVERLLRLHNQLYFATPLPESRMKEIFESMEAFRKEKSFNKRQKRFWVPMKHGDTEEDVYVRALEAQDIFIRHNDRGDCIEVKQSKDGPWEAQKSFTDFMIRGKIRFRGCTGLIYNEAVKKGKGMTAKKLSFKAGLWTEVSAMIQSENSIDPFVEDYLKKPNGPLAIAKKMNEDKVDPEELSIWKAPWEIFDLKGCSMYPETDPELAKWMIASPLFGVAARAVNPGAKHDQMVVLIGPQESGKSSVCEWLVPPVDGWFTRSIDFKDDSTEIIAKVCKTVIAEFPEIRIMNDEMEEAVKAFLSAGADMVRFKYRRDPVVMKRRGALMATSNNPTVLPRSVEGHRRFLPNVVRQHKTKSFNDVHAYMGENLDQWYADALYWTYFLGRNSELPEDIKPKQREATKVYSGVADDRDRLDETLMLIMENNKSDSAITLSAEEIISKAGFQYPSQSLKILLSQVAKERGVQPPKAMFRDGRTQRRYSIPPLQDSLAVKGQ